MTELVATITLFIGLIGMAVIVFRKMPVLTELSPEKIEGPGILTRVKDKIRTHRALKSFSGEILLQKILSKFRVLTLRAESKTGNLLMKLRQKNKNKFCDDYWKKIRKGE